MGAFGFAFAAFGDVGLLSLFSLGASFGDVAFIAVVLFDDFVAALLARFTGATAGISCGSSGEDSVAVSCAAGCGVRFLIKRRFEGFASGSEAILSLA